MWRRLQPLPGIPFIGLAIGFTVFVQAVAVARSLEAHLIRPSRRCFASGCAENAKSLYPTGSASAGGSGRSRYYRLVVLQDRVTKPEGARNRAVEAI